MTMLPTKSALSIARDKAVKVSVQINMLTVKTRQTFVLIEGRMYWKTDWKREKT